jgi:hypothetical protein
MSAKLYGEQLNKLKIENTLLLSDYNRYYVNAKLDPDSIDKQNTYIRMNTNISNNQRHVESLGNDINTDIKSNKQVISKLEKMLLKEQSINISLYNREQNIEDLDKSSIQLLEDQTITYQNIKYDIIYNIIGIVSLIYINGKILSS